MTTVSVGAIINAAAMAAVTLAGCGGSQPEGAAPEAAAQSTTKAAARSSTSKRPRGVVEDCSTRSEASFPAAFTDPQNLIVGPLVLVGAAYTPPSTVRDVGGNKFPVLLRAGHRVTVALPRRTRRVAGLGYGPLPHGVELSPHDGHRVVTFIACRRGEPSGSDADRQPVTFWSGFVLTRSPRCIPLEVWINDEPAPRRVMLRMGVRQCP